MHRDFLWRIDSNAHLVASDGQDCQIDAITDADGGNCSTAVIGGSSISPWFSGVA